MGIRHAVKNLSAPSVAIGLVLGLACAGGGAIAAAQITGGQIKDRTITHRDVASKTLKNRNMKEGSIKSKTIADGSLTGADVRDGSLEATDVGVYFAVLTDEGVLVRSSGGVVASRITGGALGRYQVDFNRNITLCAWTATVGSVTAGTAQGQAGTGLLAGTTDTVRVNTVTSDTGDAVNRPIHVVVVC
jgi:hypothetical protein